MSTHGRSGPGRWLPGSVAGKIVRHSGIFDEPRFFYSLLPAATACFAIGPRRGRKPASYFPLFSLQEGFYVATMTDYHAKGENAGQADIS